MARKHINTVRSRPTKRGSAFGGGASTYLGDVALLAGHALSGACQKAGRAGRGRGRQGGGGRVGGKASLLVLVLLVLLVALCLCCSHVGQLFCEKGLHN